MEKEGNFTARSEASFNVLLALRPTVEISSSSSKSSMSSTVNSLSCAESRDSDLDRLEAIEDGGKAWGGVETAIGGTAVIGTGGGGLLGGEPEDSGSVTK